MISRRRWMLAGTTAVLSGCARPPGAPAPGPLRAEDALWLDRLSWGLNDSSAAACQRLGRATWLAQQLRPVAWPPLLPPAAQGAVERMTITQVPMADLARRMDAQRKAAEALPESDTRVAALQAWQQEMNRLAREAAQRQLLRALYAGNQLQDQLGWFWFNHFNVHQQKSNLRVLVGDHDEQLHALALGRFRELLGAVVFHPAMLRYLDNEQNAIGRVNENLGRELLELHTLGVDGGYSQRDVQELARVLTGLGVNLSEDRPKLSPARMAQYQRRGLTEFHPLRHDFGPKTLLGEPVSGEGVAEIEGVLDRLARHPATARHISRKLAQYFVADAPPEALVDRLAQRFLASDGHIGQVMRTLVDSPEFSASLGQRFKDPLHYVLSALRQAYDGQTIVNTAPIQQWLQRLGQPLYGRQTPDGYPLDSSAWNGPGQMVARFEVARALGSPAPGLFRAEARPAPAASAAVPAPPPPPPVPQLRGPAFQAAVQPGLSDATRQVLAQAPNPAAWNSLWLSSPEFMRR